MHAAPAFTLTRAILATHAGAQVLALAGDDRIIGAAYALSATKPEGYTLRSKNGRPRVVSLAPPSPDAPPPSDDAPGMVTQSATVAMVTVEGPIQERAQQHDPCSAWTMGYDTIAASFCGACTDPASDAILMSFRSPGGAAAGMFSGIDRMLAAKAACGKEVVGIVDEECASAAYAIAAALCDVLVMPAAGYAGSIGCRAGTYNQSEALAREGIAYTAWGWPPPAKGDDVSGKLAGHPDLPPSAIHDARGLRDTEDMGQMFGALVERHRAGTGLTMAAILALKADMLRGPAALAAGLVDMLGTREDAMALAMSKAMARRMEQGAPPPADPDDDEERDDDAAPPPMMPLAPPAPRTGEPPRMSKLAAFAALVGLGADTPEPAILAALTPLVALGRATMKAGAATDPEDGAAWIKRAGQALAAEPERVKALADANAAREVAERFKLGDDLVAKGYDPGAVFLYGEVDGKRVRLGLVDEYAAPKRDANGEEIGMTLGTLRGFVRRAAERPGAAPRSPFAEPVRRPGSAPLATDAHVIALAHANGTTPEAMAMGMAQIDAAIREAARS